MSCASVENNLNPSQNEDRWKDGMNDNNTDRHSNGHREEHTETEDNMEDDMTKNQSNTFEAADVDEMTSELSGDGKVKVESEALTSMADSTMKDCLGSAEAPDKLDIRCCVERVSVGHSTSTTNTCPSDKSSDLEHDSKVIIPSETTIGDLVQTVLRVLHYHDTDLLGSRGMIVIKNWKPMTLEAITDDPQVKVGDLLAGLSTLVTLRIQLRCFSKFRQIEDVKEKLLCFLLRHSQELLQTSGCPIVQTAFEEILGDKSNLPEDLRDQFHEWYRDQVNSRRIRPSGTHVPFSTTNGPSNTWTEPEKDRDESGIPPSRASLPAAAKTLGRLWLDHNGEHIRLKHRRKEGTSLRRDDLRSPKYHPNDTPDNVTETRFNNSFPSHHRHAPLELNTRSNLAPPQPGTNTTTRKDKRDSDSKLVESSAESDDEEEQFPELPNKNAVYVIRPLPISSSSSESMEVILADSDTNSNDPFSTPEPQDLTKTVSSSTTTATTAADDRKRRDINHVGDETLLENSVNDHLPTNLSLRDVTKSLEKVSGEERGIVVERNISKKEPGDSLDLKRSGVFTSQPPTKIGRYDNRSDDMYIRNSSPKLPQTLPSSFGLLPLQQHHSHPHHHQGNHQPHHPHQQHQHQTASHLLALSHTMNFMRQLHGGPPMPIHQPFKDYINLNDNNSSDGDQKKRSRVFIDPISETPKLEEWFAVDSHPSTSTIEDLTMELNRSVYRQRFPKLEPKNVQLWFKNHRAKVKRLKSESTTNGRL